VSPSDPLLDPIGAVSAMVVATDPSLGRSTVRQIIEEVSGGRAKRRRLALALSENPSVLTTGRAPAPRVVGDLLLALRAAGSETIAVPQCARCGREVTLMQLRGENWYCSPCFCRPQVCAACGHERQVTFRDREGRPRCGGCRDEETGDPATALVELITSIDAGLSAEAARTAITATVVKPAHFQKLLWALTDAPELLTGEGAKAPFPMVLRLIDALCKAGATVVRRPGCGRCGRVIALSKTADGLRICRRCCARAHAVPCARCGSIKEPAARDADGQPLCPFCLINDPMNREECIRCGRRQRVCRRSEQGPICAACVRAPISTCSMCGRLVPCRTSTVTGQPLCAACATADPTIWKTCPSCGDSGRLITRVCLRCGLRQRVDELLSDGSGKVRPELGTLYEALVGIDRPATALHWLSRNTVTCVLSELARGARPLTHATLDELAPTKTLAHLRAVLVATGILPDRDEHLIQLEAWTAKAVAARSDSDERQLLHRYAIWHVLRRLRQRTRDTRATANQAKVARENIAAAAAFLDWLAAAHLTLRTCTQLHLDQWMVAAATTARRGRTGPFVRWAKKEGLTGLDFPATPWNGPSGVLDTEGRWDHARRLIHDDALTPEHRVAGLLVLLYAQQPATISRLSVDHVEIDDEEVRLRLGREPVVVPEPLADLVRQLLATRGGHARIGSQGSSPWLFPGGRPGQPISSFQLSERLHRIGLQPGPARSSALFQLASELPAAVLARLLGIHISVAVKWQRVSAGDWTNYAAEVSRRTTSRAE
jgi:hypothetical protein